MSPETQLLWQNSHFAIVSNALPSLVAVPIYCAVCLGLTVKSGLFRWGDLVLLVMVAAVQVLLIAGFAGQPRSSLGVFVLAWPLIGFLAAYGVWRIAGKRPLQDWPWYRFGLFATLLLLLVDVGGAYVLVPEPGKIWRLGGAGVLDALVCAPPALMLAFHWLLDCRSPLVFCSKDCRAANRCLFDLAAPAPAIRPYPLWQRSVWSALLALVIFFAVPALTGEAPPDTSASLPFAPQIEQLVAETSARYGIAPPEIKLSRMHTASYTGNLDDARRQSAIFLGQTYLRNPALAENLALTKAIVAHELGHAIVYARGHGYPAGLLLVAYVLILAMILFAMPSRRSALLCGVLLLGAFVILLSLNTSLSFHAAVQRIILLTCLSGAIWALSGGQPMLWPRRWARHFPGRTTLLVAGAAASLIYYLGFALIGARNTEIELFADQVAACTVGANNVIDTLTVLQSHPASSELVAAIRDPFHPSFAIRTAALRTLAAGDMQLLCEGVRRGGP